MSRNIVVEFLEKYPPSGLPHDLKADLVLVQGSGLAGVSVYCRETEVDLWDQILSQTLQRDFIAPFYEAYDPFYSVAGVRGMRQQIVGKLQGVQTDLPER